MLPRPGGRRVRNNGHNNNSGHRCKSHRESDRRRRQRHGKRRGAIRSTGHGPVQGAGPVGRRPLSALRIHIDNRRGRQRSGHMGHNHQQTDAVRH